MKNAQSSAPGDNWQNQKPQSITAHSHTAPKEAFKMYFVVILNCPRPGGDQAGFLRAVPPRLRAKSDIRESAENNCTIPDKPEAELAYAHCSPTFSVCVLSICYHII